MDNKKIFGIIIIVIGLIIILAIVYFIFFYRFDQTEEITNQPEQPAATLTQVSTTTSTETKPKTQTVKKSSFSQEDLSRLAMSFAERFGSYSNQSDYGNIRDLKIFMSAKMQAWADDYIAQAIAKKTDTSIYYGITTKAAAAEVKQYDNDAGQAEILVKTKRWEATGSGNNATSFSQDIIIKFVKENGAWKADNAFWQSR